MTPDSKVIIRKELASLQTLYITHPSIWERLSVDRVDLPAGTRVHQSGKLEGVALNEPQIFAVSENGQLIHAPRGNPRTGAKHTELTGGGPAKAAGEFKLVGENKIQINNQSGRYIRQSPEGVQRVADYFKSLGYEVEIVATPF